MNDLINARCGWAGTDELYVKYHDEEWGKPVDDDRILFEFLVLESAQAGLSWITILRKREGYRKAFHRFDPERVAQPAGDELDTVVVVGQQLVETKTSEIATYLSNRQIEALPQKLAQLPRVRGHRAGRGVQRRQ